VEDLVEAEQKKTGRPPKDRRTIVNGISWILRTGASWRDPPERPGKWQTVCHHFNNWTKEGTFDTILRRLHGAMVDANEIDDDLWCADGTIVRAARYAAGPVKKGPESNARLQAVVVAVLPRESTFYGMARPVH
jgi:transposase